MSDHEIKKAQLQAEQSRAELEQALDHLREKIEENSGRFQEIQGKVLHVKDKATEAAENPRKFLGEYANDGVRAAEQFVSKYAHERRQVVTDFVNQAKNELESTVQQAMDETQRHADEYIGRMHQSVEKGLSVMEDKRVAYWITVFFIGFIAGALFARRFGMRRPIGRAEAQGVTPLKSAA